LAVPFYLRSGYTTGDWHDIIVPLRETVRMGKRLQGDKPLLRSGGLPLPASAPGL
jgi:hypothetical protein